ncbi:MAG: flagellar basal body P-ring protein FlgI [Beijerinckiaceae bacterium]|nr:flagellar basal body P-ring protein FlgI [Beijerinckiaceae bacterium]
MKTLVLVFALTFVTTGIAWATSRVKDITAVAGVRDNQLTGYGLIVGLSGSGDSLRNSPFTEQAMQSMLDRLSVNTRGNQLRSKNVAAVIVTADLPPFVKKGARLDVTVSSLGDSTSLMGGTLLQTHLKAADGTTYAIAQGQLSVSGFSVQGRAEILTQGVPTAARIPNGAIVEAEVPFALKDLRTITLTLHNPDFNTSSRIAKAINEYSRREFKLSIADEIDMRSVKVSLVPKVTTTSLLARIGSLQVETDAPARVVIDSRTGTVVIGKDVKINASAVTHGNLTVRVTETQQVSQPPGLSAGETKVTSTTNINAEESGGQFIMMQGPNLRTLIRGLNQSGVKPNAIIAIIQALKTAGALQAEVIVQ